LKGKDRDDKYMVEIIVTAQKKT